MSVWLYPDIICDSKWCSGDYSRWYVVSRTSYVTVLVATIVFPPIHQIHTVSVFYWNWKHQFFHPEKVFLGVINSTMLKVCINYCYCCSLGIFCRLLFSDGEDVASERDYPIWHISVSATKRKIITKVLGGSSFFFYQEILCSR